MKRMRPGFNMKMDVVDTIIHGLSILFTVLMIAFAFLSSVSAQQYALLLFLYLGPILSIAYMYPNRYGFALGLIFIGIVFIKNMWMFISDFPNLMILLITLFQVLLFLVILVYVQKRVGRKQEKNANADQRQGLSAKPETDESQGVLETLLRVIDAKDAYTFRHSQRVAFYAKKLAQSMNLPEEKVERIHIAGMLHDIGKIGVKETIINKNEQLDGRESEEVKKHPVIGASIAENLNLFKDVLPGIRYHHERYDGSGYPEGLKGDEIPLEARILSIADAFDAMTSDRSYRKALSTETAQKLLIKNLGDQFDPQLVLLFADLLKRRVIVPGKIHDDGTPEE